MKSHVYRVSYLYITVYGGLLCDIMQLVSYGVSTHLPFVNPLTISALPSGPAAGNGTTSSKRLIDAIYSVEYLFHWSGTIRKVRHDHRAASEM